MVDFEVVQGDERLTLRRRVFTCGPALGFGYDEVVGQLRGQDEEVDVGAFQGNGVHLIVASTGYHTPEAQVDTRLIASGQGQAGESIDADDPVIIDRKGDVGEASQETHASVAEVDLGLQIVVDGRFDPVDNLIFEQHGGQQQEAQEQHHKDRQADQNTFGHFHLLNFTLNSLVGWSVGCNICPRRAAPA